MLKQVENINNNDNKNLLDWRAINNDKNFNRMKKFMRLNLIVLFGALVLIVAGTYFYLGFLQAKNQRMQANLTQQMHNQTKLMEFWQENKTSIQNLQLAKNKAEHNVQVLAIINLIAKQKKQIQILSIEFKLNKFNLNAKAENEKAAEDFLQRLNKNAYLLAKLTDFNLTSDKKIIFSLEIQAQQNFVRDKYAK